MHLGLLKDYLRFLAGDLSHSRSVSRSVRTLYFFLGLLFDLIYSCKINCRMPFPRGIVLLHEEYVSTYFLATSKGWFLSGLSYLV